MSSANLSGKRRRVDNAASTLSKPFKSPLRRPAMGQGTVALPHDEKDAAFSSEPASQPGNWNKKSPDSISTPVSSFTATELASTFSPSNPQTRKRKTPTDSLTPSKKPILPDPDVMDLQKQQRALQSRLLTLRSELDTAQQALRVETLEKDAELEKLISKWKSISQDVADEVFVGAQQRVSRMGGMKAWREQTKNNSAKWDQEEMGAWHGSAEADVDDDLLESRKAELLDQVETFQDENEVTQKDESGEEEFTMGSMLKTMNIDFKAIGYDKFDQRWMKD